MRILLRQLLVLAIATMLLAACTGGASSEPTEAVDTQPTAATADQPTETPAPEVTATEGSAMMEGMYGMPAVDPLAVEPGDILVAGSSTVYPLTTAIAERFKDEGFEGEISIDSIGSGAGFERFCVNAETDIANASRAIKEEEAQACEDNGRPAVEFRVGTDALAIVVNPELAIEELSEEQLAQIFSGEVTNWNEIDAAAGDVPISLFSPGSDSGTYDYFVEEIFAEDEAPIQGAAGIQFSEDDNVLVQGVEGSAGGIGYFGYAYYKENADKLKILKVNGVEPNDVTAESGEYPLARPLFIYSSPTIFEEKPYVADFVNYYLSYVDEEISDVGYFPASDEALTQSAENWLDAQP